jgi:hypothetical protein
MNAEERQKFLLLIESHINNYGFHITIVNNIIEPRFAYSIGLREKFNFELIFAGGIYYKKNDLILIFNECVKELKKGENIKDQKITIDTLGTFSFTYVDPSWSKLTMLGVLDYYNTSDINAFQIVPDESHFTLDIPDMSKEWTSSSEPVWQWLGREWDYTVPANSTVVTNIQALLGEPITELTRLDNNEWEMFAGFGPDVKKENVRVVSLGTILGIDKSILPATNLEIGKGLWRDSSDSNWNDWG